MSLPSAVSPNTNLVLPTRYRTCCGVLAILALSLGCGLATAGRIAAGTYNAYAVDTDGSVWVWGANLYGQLCDGTNTHRSTPARIAGFSGAATVSAGGAHGLVLKADGAAAGWGLNGQDSSGRGGGQLGDGTQTNRAVPGGVSSLAKNWQVVAGQYHSLAVLGDNSVAAWGYNAQGQLGAGSTQTRTAPVSVVGTNGVIAVAAGCTHSLALKTDGTVLAWGYNSTGQLGDRSNVSRTTPVAVSGLTNVAAIAAGCAHSVALKNDGTVWAWGFNFEGQLGGATANIMQTSPLQISGLANVTAIAAGNHHTLALRSDGSVWSWGKNDQGQIGDGSTTNRTSPAPIPGLASVTDISAGQAFSMALSATGTLYTWGQNDYGQLGNGNFQTSVLPTPVRHADGSAFNLATVGTSDLESVFRLAEAALPAFFSPPTSTVSAFGYRARAYSSVILAARDGRVLAIGPAAGGIMDLGSTFTLRAQAQALGF